MTAVFSKNAPAAVGPYSQGIAANGFVFVSGQLPIDGATGKMPDTVVDQTKQSIQNIAHILKEAGMDLGNVVKTTVFLKNMSDFAAMNDVYASYFKEPFPARAAYEVARLPKDALVEIEAIACK